MVKLLIERGADVNIVNDVSISILRIYLITIYQDKWSALYIASSNGHKDVVRMLLNGGADINTIDKVNESDYSMVKLL